MAFQEHTTRRWGGFSYPPTEDRTVPRPPVKTPGEARLQLRELTERSLLQQYAPVGALVNERGEILYLHGRTGQYLEPAPGEAGMDILKMAHEGLRRELTSAFRKAIARRIPVRYPGLRVKTNGDFTTVTLTVRPVAADSDATADQNLFLIILEETPVQEHTQAEKSVAGDSGEDAKVSTDDVDARIEALKLELRTKEEYLQTANEELETSKEELQSVNEELATVNAELQTKVTDLSRANNDMSNLLSSTGIGTVFVDHQLRILRFTPAVTQVINLILTDVGRPVGHIVSNLIGYDRLVEDVQQVLFLKRLKCRSRRERGINCVSVPIALWKT